MKRKYSKAALPDLEQMLAGIVNVVAEQLLELTGRHVGVALVVSDEVGNSNTLYANGSPAETQAALLAALSNLLEQQDTGGDSLPVH